MPAMRYTSLRGHRPRQSPARVSEPAADPVVREARQQIAALDSAIVEALNRRIELVEELLRHKQAHGLPFVDRARESQQLELLRRASRGALSAEGLGEIYAEILALVKREVERRGGEA